MIEIGFDKGTAMDIINGELFGAIKTRGGFPVRVLAWDVKSR